MKEWSWAIWTSAIVEFNFMKQHQRKMSIIPNRLSSLWLHLNANNAFHRFRIKSIDFYSTNDEEEKWMWSSWNQIYFFCKSRIVNSILGFHCVHCKLRMHFSDFDLDIRVCMLYKLQTTPCFLYLTTEKGKKCRKINWRREIEIPNTDVDTG